MKLYAACVKSFEDIELSFTIENTFGSTSEHKSSVTVMTDFDMTIKTSLKDVLDEYQHRFNYDLKEAEILDKIEKYGDYSRHDGHTEIFIKIAEVTP